MLKRPSPPSPQDSHLLTHVDHSHWVEDAKDQEEDQGDAEDLKLLTEKINLMITILIIFAYNHQATHQDIMIHYHHT